MQVLGARRARREAERHRRSGRRAVLGGLGILVLGGASLSYVVFGEASPQAVPAIPAQCTSTQRVPVLTDPTMAAVLEAKPVDETSCIVLDTAPPSPDSGQEQDAGRDLSAGLWIPASSAQISSRGGNATPVTRHTDSLASSPAVVVSPAHAREFTTWSEVIGDDTVLLADPRHAPSAHAAMRSAVAEMQQHTTSRQQLRTAVVARSLDGAPQSDSRDDAALVEQAARQQRPAVVSERCFLDYVDRESDDAMLRASVPGASAWLLDYPLLVPSQAGRRNATIATAADEIARFVASPAGREALARHHLRPADGARLPSALSVDVRHRLDVRDEKDWSALLTTWRRQHSPHNTLYVLDASAAMAETSPGLQVPPWRTAVESTVVRTQFLPDRDSVGLWLSARGDDRDRSYRQLVPIRDVDRAVGELPQRTIVQDALAEASVLEDSRSGIYDTTLAAVRTVREHYRDGAINSVVVISHGGEHNGGASLETTLRELKREASAQQPVYVTTIAIAPAPAPQDLQALAEATGGTAHSATTLQGVQEQYLYALSQL